MEVNSKLGFALIKEVGVYGIEVCKNGRVSLRDGGALGGCADITAWPVLKDQPNVTFLGLGCRLKSGLDACYLMIGISGNLLEKVHAHILDMAKPIAMLRNAQSKK